MYFSHIRLNQFYVVFITEFWNWILLPLLFRYHFFSSTRCETQTNLNHILLTRAAFSSFLIGLNSLQEAVFPFLERPQGYHRSLLSRKIMKKDEKKVSPQRFLETHSRLHLIAVVITLTIIAITRTIIITIIGDGWPLRSLVFHLLSHLTSWCQRRPPAADN